MRRKTHFLIRYDSLQKYKQEDLELKRTNQELMEDTINNILLFRDVALGEEERFSCFLLKRWTERKRLRSGALQTKKTQTYSELSF